MNYPSSYCWLLCLALSTPVGAQVVDKAMTFDNLVNWNRISARTISDDGRWVACQTEPWVGDATVTLYGDNGREAAAFYPASGAHFSSSSRYLLTVGKPSMQLTDSLKLKKSKEEAMPMDYLILYTLSGKQETIDSLKSHKLAEAADWLAYQCGRKDSTLHIRTLDGSKTMQFPAVTDYRFAKKSSQILFVSAGTEAFPAGLYTLNPESGTPLPVKEGKGLFRQMNFDEAGKHLAFLYCAEKDSAYKAMELWLSTQNAPAVQLAMHGSHALPKGWVVSEHAELQFSKQATRLFFGSSPKPMQKDSTQLPIYRPEVQVWSWNEAEQYTVQHQNRDKELKRSYRAVYNLDKKIIHQLACPEWPEVELGNEGDAPLALLSTSKPYSLSSMWEGRTRRDYCTVSLETGKRTPLLSADYGSLSLSPAGTYAYWYAETDSSWYTLALESGQKHRLTTPQSFPAWDEENDVPNYPDAYGLAGWTAKDQALIIYDRFDLWRFSPTASTPPTRLTTDGREKKRTYRLLRLDREARFFDLAQPQLLSAFDQTTKGSGYYEAKLTAPSAPTALLSGDFMLRTPLKAKHADAVVYTSESFTRYPDLYLSTLKFKKSLQLTQGGKQQEGIRWGTAELVHWTSLDGRPLEGVVYKPANFDPTRKYPLIVNFYERNAHTLYNYRMPEPDRSTIDYHFYNSHEYIIFNPDVRYTDGYPGASCYNSVMPGITHFNR